MTITANYYEFLSLVMNR